jgi:glucose/arabinose dehydrogenase
VIDGLDPDKQAGHFWKFFALGPDGKLYYNVGAPGNIVMPGYYQATISRVDPNTGITENYVQGVRNSVGFDWHPKTRELWFGNHARDWVSDDLPHDTLHRVSRKGMHFGYPWCHQGDFLDPEFGKGPLLQGVRRAGPQARRARRARRHALLHRQDVPGRVPEQHLHRAARLVEPQRPIKATT